MEARFFCKTGALAGTDHRIGGNATIGRGPSNTIVVADGVVSKTHARIAFDVADAAWTLEDLGSTNGTRLDGMPVSGRVRLGDLHVVTLGGRHDFIFVVPAGNAAPDSTPAALTGDESAPAAAVPVPAGEANDLAPPAADRGPAAEAQTVGEPATRYEPASVLSVPPLVVRGGPAADEAGDPPAEGARPGGAAEAASVGMSSAPATRYEPASVLSVPPLVAGGGPAADEATPPAGTSFEVRAPDGEPRRIRLGDGRHVLGRAKDCDVAIDDRTLSHRHAALIVRGGRVTVVDLGSLNGSFVNGTRVRGETEVGIGGSVELGEVVTVVRVAP